MPLINPNFAQAFQGAYQAVPGWQQSNLIQNQAAYLGQQALQTSLDNQQTQMLMPLFQKATQGGGIHPTFNTSSGQTPSSDLDVGDATNQATGTQAPALSTGSVNAQNSDDLTKAMEAHVRAHANKYAPVNLAMDPQNAQTYQGLQTAAGMNPKAKGLADGFRTEFEARQAMTNQMNQIQAEKAYVNAMSVYKADDASVRSVLNQVDPAAEKNPMLDKLTPAQMREYAGTVASTYFPYTGRPMQLGQDGKWRDGKSTDLLPMAAEVGLKPEDYQKEVDYWAGSDKFTINGEDRMVPRWMGTNAQSAQMGQPARYASAYDAARQNVSSTNSLMNSTGKGVDQQGNSVGFINKPTNVMVSQNPGGKLYTGVEPTDQASIDVSKLPASPKAIGMNGTSTDPGATEYAQAHAKALQTIQETTQPTNLYTAQKGIFDERNLLKIINNPSTSFGPGTGAGASVQAVVESFLGEGNSPKVAQFMGDPSNRFLLGKLLGNEAIQQYTAAMKQAGGTERMSAYLSNIITQQLSANPNLVRDAARQMLRLDLGNNLYEAQKWGGDYKAAAASGRDMVQYDGQYGNQKPYYKFMPQALASMDQNGNIKSQAVNGVRPPISNKTAQAAEPPAESAPTANMMGGTVKMVDPTGKPYDIPLNLVDEVTKAGMKRL